MGTSADSAVLMYSDFEVNLTRKYLRVVYKIQCQCTVCYMLPALSSLEAKLSCHSVPLEVKLLNNDRSLAATIYHVCVISSTIKL